MRFPVFMIWKSDFIVIAAYSALVSVLLKDVFLTFKSSYSLSELERSKDFFSSRLSFLYILGFCTDFGFIRGSFANAFYIFSEELDFSNEEFFPD